MCEEYYFIDKLKAEENINSAVHYSLQSWYSNFRLIKFGQFTDLDCWLSCPYELWMDITSYVNGTL